MDYAVNLTMCSPDFDFVPGYRKNSLHLWGIRYRITLRIDQGGSAVLASEALPDHDTPSATVP